MLRWLRARPAKAESKPKKKMTAANRKPGPAIGPLRMASPFPRQEYVEARAFDFAIATYVRLSCSRIPGLSRFNLLVAFVLRHVRSFQQLIERHSLRRANTKGRLSLEYQ